ncbi:hypothetical protein SAMN03159341_1048 [Paenibacillus sp. 1_12]|uniref:hypothetical protein n=1 Tax=Paenibacillus sp. 1_12 TaxID=1566278 RepID=UPI0008F04936|nr:hypothetical protein [Paenibacillus sp. 1_12]SFL20762.1 hypothetical protein SAMN03159341_1048 [Paenibacillus sp. 1_12]
MRQQQLPEWAKPSFDGRFNMLATLAGKQQEIEPLRLKQVELEDQLKQEVTPRQYQLLLEWEETLNHRNALEKEFMFLAGIKDGMKCLKELYEFASD